MQGQLTENVQASTSGSEVVNFRTNEKQTTFEKYVDIWFGINEQEIMLWKVSEIRWHISKQIVTNDARVKPEVKRMEFKMNSNCKQEHL